MTERQGACVSVRCHPPDPGAAAAPASLPDPASKGPRNQALAAGMPVARGHLARPCRALRAGGPARPSKQDTCIEAGGWGSHGGRPSGLGSRGRSVARQERGSCDAAHSPPQPQACSAGPAGATGCGGAGAHAERELQPQTQERCPDLAGGTASTYLTLVLVQMTYSISSE